MSFSDETLMAYADGELDEVTRRAIEEAMRKDANIARRVARHKAMRADVFAAYAPIADEPVPRRLAQPVRAATVVQLDAVRASRAATQSAAKKADRSRKWSWPEWGALAATLVVGVVAGKFGFANWEMDTDAQVLVASSDSGLSADGRLATALERQLSGAPASANVRVGVSFVATDGSYCRSFTAAGRGQDVAGLACKNGTEWQLPMIVQNARPEQRGAYRQAAATMPPAVLEAIDQRISGQTLDARGEQEALQKGWQR